MFKKNLIINEWDMGWLEKILNGRCRTIVYRRVGDTMHVAVRGMGLVDFLKVRKPLKKMALHW
jgi:hypothetical protein